MREARLVRLADVTPKPVRWLWNGYLALGKINCIVGDPGVGKSTLTVEVASRASTGTPLPGGSTADPTNALFLTAEDDAATMVRPRVEAAGGDIGRITARRYPLSLPDQLDELRDDLVHLNAKVLVIDPIMAFLAAV